jgi:hypothetical protein
MRSAHIQSGAFCVSILMTGLERVLQSMNRL